MRQHGFFYPIKAMISLAALFMILSGNTVMAQLRFGDNLGNHTATSILNMSGKNIDDIGSLRHRNMNIGNLSSGGNIGASAAATVDIYSVFSISQSTPNQTLSLWSPTVLPTAGRMVYVVNVGIASFSIAGANVKPNSALQLIYNGSAWTVFNGNGGGVVSTLGTPVFSGNANAGIPYNGTLTVTYTGGNAATYASGSDIPSTGVLGLTATLRAGTLTTTGGNLVYDITGTPASGGSATFTLDFGGQSLSSGNLTVTGVALTGGSEVFTAGSATKGMPYSGKLTIPYTGGTGAVYSAGAPVSSTGVTGLTATLEAGTLTSGVGYLVYDINGVPNTGGTAAFAINFAGTAYPVSLPVTSVGTLTCANPVFTTVGAAPVNGVPGAAYSAKMTIPYTGGSNSVGYQSGSAISSTGVIGLTATLQSGTLAASGDLTYYVSGNPMTAGVASFPINFGGMSGTAPLAVIITPTLVCGNIIRQWKDPQPNVAYTCVVNFPISGGTGAYPAGADITDAAVPGLKAKLRAGNLSTNMLIYDITGTPANGGTATFPINFYGTPCSIIVPVPTIASFGSVTFPAGNPTVGVAYTGTMVVPYNTGNGLTYCADTITVNGLTAKLAPGTVNGSGNLTYNISGTPIVATTTSFLIDLFGKTVTGNLPVIGVGTVNYAGATFSPSYALAGRAYTGTISIPYTGGSGAGYPAGGTFISTDITGLTATRIAGTLDGSNIQYSVTGTVQADVNLSFAKFNIDFYAQSGTTSLNVCNGAVKEGGVYTKNDGTYVLSSSWTTLNSKFTAQPTQDLCIYKSQPLGNSSKSAAASACNDGTGADGRSGIWRLPHLPELVKITDQGDWWNLFTNFSSTSYANVSATWSYWSSTDNSVSYSWAWSPDGSSYTSNGPESILRNYRCVRGMSH